MADITLKVTANGVTNEVQMPVVMCNDTCMDLLLRNLAERQIPVPRSPTLTVSAGGEYLLHEEPRWA